MHLKLPNREERRWSHIAVIPCAAEQNKLVPVKEVSEKQSEIDLMLAVEDYRRGQS